MLQCLFENFKGVEIRGTKNKIGQNPIILDVTSENHSIKYCPSWEIEKEKSIVNKVDKEKK